MSPACHLARISHIDVRDIARVAEALTTDRHVGKTYALSGPESLSYADTAAILSRVLDRKVDYVPVTDDAAKSTLTSGGLSSGFADLVIDFYRFYRSGKAAAVRPRAGLALGYGMIAAPKIDVGLRRLAGALRRRSSR